MSVVLWQQRKSRLSAMVDKPGGLSVGVALNQARANLDAMQARSADIVMARVLELSALPQPAADDPDPLGACTKAYQLSSAVIDAAHPFELDDLCTAAAGLCDLIDAAPAGKRFDWRIVTVHAQAMKLLLILPAEAFEARAEVLENLNQVLLKKIPHTDERSHPSR